MGLQRFEGAALALTRHVFAAAIPAFALFHVVIDPDLDIDLAVHDRESCDPGHPYESQALDHQRLKLLFAHGLSEAEAFDRLEASERRLSNSGTARVDSGSLILVWPWASLPGDRENEHRADLPAMRSLLDMCAACFVQEEQFDHVNERLGLIEQALDALPHSVFVLDKDQRYVFQNRIDRDSFVDLRGRRIEEAGLDETMSRRWAEHHEAALAGESFDRKHTNHSGEKTFVSRTMMGPIRNESGIAGIVGLALDCTAEMQAASEIEQMQLRLEAWLRLSSDWVWEADTSHRFTFVEGDADAQRLDFQSWIGRTRCEVVGIDPDHDALWSDYKRCVDNRDRIENFTFSMKRDDGSRLIAEVNAEPFFGAEGDFLGYRGVSRDVTEREEVLARLRRADIIARETNHAIIITDEMGQITWVNPGFTRLTGYEADEVVGRTPGSLIQCPETDPTTIDRIRSALRKGDGIQTTILNAAKGGRRYWLDLDIRPIHSADGKLDGFIAIENDVTDLIDEKNLKDAIFENATAGIVIHADSGATIDANFEAAQILGVTTDQLLGRTAMDPLWQLIDRDGEPLTPEAVPAIRALREDKTIRNQILGVRHGDGSVRWLRVSAQSYFVGTNARRQVLSSFVDVTEEEERARTILETQELLSTVIETMPDAVAAFDTQDRLVLCNSSYRSFYATAAPAIKIGAKFEDILRYAVAQGQFADAGSASDERERWIAERVERHRQTRPEAMLQRLDDGRWLQVRERVSPSGTIIGVRTDITSLKRAEAEVRNAAERDALTGLANRSAFMRQFGNCLNGMREGDGIGIVALIDLDHFKDLNDTLGHDVGDAFLLEIANRFRSATRTSDTVARLGGDEFAILIPGIASRDTACRTIKALVESVSHPLCLSSKIVHPQMSIGVSLFPEDGANATEILKNADIAMYETKKNGRNGVTFFDPAQKEQLSRRTFIAERLREALRGDMFNVAFQSQIDLQTGRHVGFEALARWKFAGEEISPAEFIPISEEFGLSQDIDIQVMQKSLLMLRHLMDAGHDPGHVAVNVGTHLLRNDTFPLRVANLLADTGLRPKHLEIEVTESVIIGRGYERVRNNLSELKKIGVSISLDDFGTGYASLSHLKDLIIDKIKIDKSFIDDIAIDRNDEAIVKTIINLARSLELKVVAEGVENDVQKQFLSNYGCHSAQGFMFHRPETDLALIGTYLSDRKDSTSNTTLYYRGSRVA